MEASYVEPAVESTKNVRNLELFDKFTGDNSDSENEMHSGEGETEQNDDEQDRPTNDEKATVRKKIGKKIVFLPKI